MHLLIEIVNIYPLCMIITVNSCCKYIMLQSNCVIHNWAKESIKCMCRYILTSIFY